MIMGPRGPWRSELLSTKRQRKTKEIIARFVLLTLLGVIAACDTPNWLLPRGADSRSPNEILDSAKSGFGGVKLSAPVELLVGGRSFGRSVGDNRWALSCTDALLEIIVPFGLPAVN